MRPRNYTSLSEVTNLLTKSCLRADFKDPPKEYLTDQFESFDENLYDFDELEEVFSDHILMDRRLRKTLYAADFNSLDDLPDHPPIALTGLAFELFSKAVPNYGLDILDMDYVSAASENARISPCAMIIAMIYLERLQLKKSEYLETVSPPGLFVVTMLVASKFLFENEDNIVTNQMWAEALNLDIKDLNNQERDFLSAIDWKVFVDSSEYFSYLCSIEKEIAVKQSSLRNWLSYSDMCVVIQDPNFQWFWKAFVKKFLETTIWWTFGYVATALALYSTGVSFQKTQSEDHQSPDIIQNGTIFPNTPLKESHVAKGLISNIESEFPLQSLAFKTSDQESEIFDFPTRNLHNYFALQSERKITIYKLERTRSHLLQKLRNIFHDYFSRISLLHTSTFQVNTSYANTLECLNKRHEVISALMR